MAERAVFRAVLRAVLNCSLPRRRSEWGAGLRAAAASSHFLAEETFPAGPFLDLERWLRDASGPRARRVRAVATEHGAAALAARFGKLHGELFGGDGAAPRDAVDVGLAAVRVVGAYDALLRALEHEGVADEPEPRPRDPAVLFAAGDVLRHRFFGRCVVVGWSPTCPMSEDWIAGNRIRENLVNGPDQPFYNVLLEDNDLPRCVSQENVALEPDGAPRGRLPKTFDHYGVPYYFDAEDAGDAFAIALTDELRRRFPEDDDFRASPRDFRTLEEAHRPPYLVPPARPPATEAARAAD